MIVAIRKRDAAGLRESMQYFSSFYLSRLDIRTRSTSARSRVAHDSYLGESGVAKPKSLSSNFTTPMMSPHPKHMYISSSTLSFSIAYVGFDAELHPIARAIATTNSTDTFLIVLLQRE